MSRPQEALRQRQDDQMYGNKPFMYSPSTSARQFPNSGGFPNPENNTQVTFGHPSFGLIVNN